VLCWFDPAIVAPRLAWLVEAVAFGGADGCGMAISWTSYTTHIHDFGMRQDDI
jgi:hypothetical protein